MNTVFTTLSPVGVFYPLFIFLVLLALTLRWFLRRRMGSDRWDQMINLLERFLLTAMILSMLLGAVLQIVLRNFFQTGLVWIEPLLRHLVLWICFTGAVTASGRLRHIHMDVVGHLLPEKPRLWLVRITTMAAALVCMVLARASWIYLGQEYEFGSSGFLGIPVWLLTSVIFIGFALMAERFFSRACAPAGLLLKIEQEGQEG